MVTEEKGSTTQGQYLRRSGKESARTFGRTLKLIFQSYGGTKRKFRLRSAPGNGKNSDFRDAITLRMVKNSRKEKCNIAKMVIIMKIGS